MKRADLQNNLAMTITLVMGAMLFTTLFMGYAIYRTSATVWPPLGLPRVSLTIPFLSSLVIALSSWFIHKVKHLLAAENFVQANKNLNLTIISGAGFLILQCYLWFQMSHSGLYVGTSGIFGSVLYGFTWIHALHMVLGIGALVYLKIVLKPTTSNVVQKSINVERFWHFLGIVWIIMFLILFVL